MIEVRPRRGIELPAGLPKSARRSRKKNLIRRLVETYQGQPMQLSKMARVRMVILYLGSEPLIALIAPSSKRDPYPIGLEQMVSLAS